MRGRSLKLALGLVAVGSGPLALVAWNQGLGRSGFATPVGGEKWFATRPAFFQTTGVREPELSPTGSVFNWASPDATLILDRLERSREATLTVRVQGQPSLTGRPSILILSVDGVEASRLPMPTTPKRVSVTIPKRSGRGATLSIRSEEAVGVMIENVRLLPSGRTLPLPREALGAFAFVGLAAYLSALFCGLSSWPAFLAAFAQIAALSWLSVHGGAFLGRHSESLGWLAAAGLLCSAIAGRVRDPLWRRASLIVISLSVLKLAILSHPQIVDGDAAFHAGNLKRVLSGDWFFTSATPPPAIPFPYPPGLSVVALPFSGIPQDTWVTLLRVIVVITEALAAAAFAVTVATLSTEIVGALTFILLTLSPEGLSVLFIGNLSNLFAEALLLFGCSFVITRRGFVGTLSLLGAFLSHFGTLLLGGPLAFLLALNQGEMLARAARRTAPVLVALAGAFALYYWRFLKVVADAVDRMAYAKGAAALGPMTAPLGEKIARIGGGEGWWVTAIVVVSCIIGVLTWPRHERKALARSLFTWLMVVAGFTLLGLITPVQVRTGLSARPAVAALCASGFCALWIKGQAGRATVIVLIVATAVGAWLAAISFFPARAL